MEANELVIVAAVWVAIGVVCAFVMRRRGHDFYVWLALGTVLGPLVVPLAIERARFHDSLDRRTEGIPTPPKSGFDVVAGIDGSEESMTAIRSALDLFGDSLTSLTIVTVLDYDSESSAAGTEPREQAQAMLDEAAERTGMDFVRTEILYGRADRAIDEFARTHGAELIVVGARGHGATEALFGSITERLVGAGEVPVYVGGSVSGPRQEETADMAPGAGA